MAGNNDEKQLEKTIWISKETDEWLISLKVHERESYDSVLRKIKNGEIKKW